MWGSGPVLYQMQGLYKTCFRVVHSFVADVGHEVEDLFHLAGMD